MTAGKARAGCPIRNIQSTLDGLTRSVTLNDEAGSGPGLTVAVYEESNDILSTEKGQNTKVVRKNILYNIIINTVHFCREESKRDIYLKLSLRHVRLTCMI